LADQLVSRHIAAGSGGRLASAPQTLLLVALLGCLAAGFSLGSPYFLSTANLINIMLSMSVIGVMAAVSTLILIGRGLDLSLGSVVALVGLVTATALEHGFHWAPAVAMGIATGAACGLFNGLLIVYLGINSIIVTIGTLSIYRGIAYAVSEGKSLFVSDEAILTFGAGRIGLIPAAVILMLFVFAVCHIAATYTRVGRTLYAVGANPRASRLSGISIRSYRLWIFVISGVSAAVAGILLIGQAATAVPAAGIGYELLVVTAVLLGGASLHGGEGRISGTLLGVLIIGVLNNGMTLLGVNSYFQTIAHGALLLLAVTIDQVRRGISLD
jgi:ribose/xylose/arabinose/galactoside ABC-type transport system permease subunit